MIELNKIYCEDCLETMARMPDGYVDLIVTDPPYGLNYNNGDMASRWEAIFGGDVSKSIPRPIANDSEIEANELFEEFLKEAKRILKPGCCCCCCGGGGGPKPLFANWTLLMDKYIGFKQAVVWDKPGLGMGHHYRRSYEFMLVAQKPGAACIWNGGKNTSNILRIRKIIPRADQHPTEKPVELMAKFILLHSNENDIIYDPFCGHGSTLEAAIKYNRRWIGSEINPEYVKIAEKRIAPLLAQTRLF